MKILAPFDQTEYSQATLPLLTRLADLPAAEITLLSVAHAPTATMFRRGPRRSVISAGIFDRTITYIVPNFEPSAAETNAQAIDRVLAELDDYLASIAAQLPAGIQVHCEAHISDHPAALIVERAREELVDVIVMATHSRSGLARMFFGSTTEEVVRSGVAPVLVVHPNPTPIDANAFQEGGGGHL